MKYKFTILITVLITVLSTIPVPDMPEFEDVPFFDKWVHFVMYGALTCALYLDRRLQYLSINICFIATAFLFPALWGGLMELVQKYCTTCRSGEWLDFYADTFGAFLATFISLALWKIVKTSDLK